MGFGIYSNVAGANARELELQMLANNVANMTTAGFKEVQPSFTSELEKNVPHDEIDMAQALVREGKQHINFTQGSLYVTGNPLDVAIQGDGFFEVDTPMGIRYTRNGNFTLNSEGQLVTLEGYKVMTEGGPVALPPDSNQVTISPAGLVSVGDEGVGTLRVVTTQNKNVLKLEGGNLYSATNADFTPSENFRIAQQHLESSNVDVIRTMVRMIEVARTYEAHQKSMAKQSHATEQLTQIAKGG